jgi:hypothetical protein
MNASKENARKANSYAYDLSESLRGKHAEKMLFLRDFLSAAERKLPTEQAFNRDRQRRRDKAKASKA